MCRQSYRPWSRAEEDNLEEWVAQHLDLTWDERAEEYSQTVCPRSSESLRSKLRQVKRNIRRRRALNMGHLRSRRVMMTKMAGRRQQAAPAPSRFRPCRRYVTSRQISIPTGLHELPSEDDRIPGRQRLSVNEQPESSLTDQFHSAKSLDAYMRMEFPPQSKLNAVPGKPVWSFQVSQKTPQTTNLLWHVVSSLAGHRRR